MADHTRSTHSIPILPPNRQIPALSYPSAPTPSLPTSPFGAAARSEELSALDLNALEDWGVMQRVSEAAAEYNIDPTGKSPITILQIAQSMEVLRRVHSRRLRVGDPLPNQSTSELRGYADYYQDINKLASPRAMGIGGGYSYRGIDPFPLGKEKPE